MSILYYSSLKSRSIGELSALVGIAQKNIIARVKILKEKKYILTEPLGKGKKTLVKLNPDKKNELKRDLEAKEFELKINNFLLKNPSKSKEVLDTLRKTFSKQDYNKL